MSVAVVGTGAAVVVARAPESPAPVRSATSGGAATSDDDASALVEATLRHGTPLSAARGDRLAAPRRAELEGCADAFRAAPEHRKAELTAFYEAAVTEPVFRAEAPRLARWTQDPPPGTKPDTDITDARAALREQLRILSARYRAPIDGCATVRAWRAGDWGADARPPALVAVNRSLLEEQRSATAHRVALRDGARRVRASDAPGANRAAHLLKAGVVIPTGIDNSSPIVAALNEDDAFVE
ncbi:MAG: hypothetical protein ACEQSX_16125 [Baekduiaceae bacterium]